MLKFHHFSREKGLKGMLINFLLTKRNIYPLIHADLQPRLFCGFVTWRFNLIFLAFYFHRDPRLF